VHPCFKNNFAFLVTRRQYNGPHLESAGNDTRVRVIESGFASLPPEQLARYADHIREGWPIMLGMLAAYFEKK
jgi:hypothetical protein